MRLSKFFTDNLKTGRISEITALLCDYNNVTTIQGVRTEDKLDALCIAAGISREALDTAIASSSSAIRTIKGHAFEIIFSKILQLNDIPHDEIGGDTPFDFQILGKTLQLKTPYLNGCGDGVIAYKTHKTHGPKSEDESEEYFHQAKEFADYLIGLISYEPFRVFVIPRDAIPRWEENPEYLASPAYLNVGDYQQYINNFTPLGITDDITYPQIVALAAAELLPKTAARIGIRSNYILDAIYQPENFRIWDMNLRGFIRETQFRELVRQHGIISVDPRTITTRPEKVDLALEDLGHAYTRFQIKGLTYSSARFKGADSTVDCETQLSRGRVNDHPTQSRLYYATDFDSLLLAMDPAYTNAYAQACYGQWDFKWSFYAIPVQSLARHKEFNHRLASHQYLKYTELQKFRIADAWFGQWRQEAPTA